MDRKQFQLDEEEIRMLLQAVMYFGGKQWGAEDFYDAQKRWLSHNLASDTQGAKEVEEIMKFTGYIHEKGEKREFNVQKFMELYTRLCLPVLDKTKPVTPKIEDLPTLNVTSDQINEQWIMEHILGIKKEEKNDSEE